MEESVLLGTKPLVDSIRHFIRDPSGVFSVCHLCECRIVQWRHDSRLLLLLNWFLASRLLFRIKSPYNKKNIKRWLEDMNFMFSWQEQYLTSERSERVRYWSCHSNIKFISSRHRAISSMSYVNSVAQSCSIKTRLCMDRSIPVLSSLPLPLPFLKQSNTCLP